MKKTLSIIAIFVVILSLLASSSVMAKSGNQISSEITTDNSGNSEMKKFPDFEPSKPIPESEMTHIPFSETWILNNDVDKDPNTVKISFPESWLKNAPQLKAEDRAIELSVPTILLMDHNESETPNEITVSFPNDYFKGLPVPSMTIVPEASSTEKTGNSTDDIQYFARKAYQRNSGDNITGAYGSVVPQSYSNPQGETFLAYHEIEFYSNTNFVSEIVSGFNTDPNWTRVFWAITIGGVYQSWWYLGINAQPGDHINYEFYSRSTSNLTYCFLQDTYGNWYMQTYTYSMTPNDYYLFIGSSELYITSLNIAFK